MTDATPNPYAAPATTSQTVVDENDPLAGGRYRGVAIGLKTMYWGIVLLILSMFASFIVPIIAWRGMVVTALPSVMAIGTLASMVLVACGPIICLSVPPDSGLRPYVLASVILEVSTVVFAMSAGLVLGAIATLVGFGLVFLTAASFLLFLYRLAIAIKRYDLSRRSRNVFVVGGFVATTLTAVIVMSRFAQSGTFIGILGLATFVGALLFLVTYANLLNGLGNAIRHPGRAMVGIG